MNRILLSLLSLLMIAGGLIGQPLELHQFRQDAKNQVAAPGGLIIEPVEEPVCLYRAQEEAMRTHVAPPELSQQNGRAIGTDCGNIIVNYSGFENFPEAQAAFQYAVDIWSSLIQAPVPIVIDASFEPLGPGVLGAAGPTFRISGLPGAPSPGTFYNVALANQLVGFDIVQGAAHIQTFFNTDFGWYFGRDGNPPPGTYDFATVVLHELGHGLGFTGLAAVQGPDAGIYGTTIYDFFVETGAGNPLSSIAPPFTFSPLIADALQSNDLFVNAPSAAAALNGSRPPIFVPSTFLPGSSYSHWDEATFPAGTPQSLMTPFLGFQEANHDPGAITLGMFDDHGWSETLDCLPPQPVDDTQPCDIAEITLDPAVPFPICDVNGVVGPPGSHALFVRVGGINPLSQPVDPSKYEAKIKGKVYPIVDVGYDFFEGEQYLFLLIGGIPSDGKKNQQVKITLENGCVAVAPRLYTAPICPGASLLGTEESAIEAESALEVFPNPTSGIFTLRAGKGNAGQLQIFNAMGQRVLDARLQEEEVRQVDLSAMENGLYLIRLQAKERTLTKQILLNR